MYRYQLHILKKLPRFAREGAHPPPAPSPYLAHLLLPGLNFRPSPGSALLHTYTHLGHNNRVEQPYHKDDCGVSTLPVHHGGPGIQSAVQLAPSAILASAAASSKLARLILPANMQPYQFSYLDDSLGPKDARNKPLLMLLHGIHSDYLLLQTHCSKTHLII